MSFIRRLFGSAPAQPAQLIDAETFAGRDRTVEVVGESNYQAALAQIAGPKEDRGKNHWTTGELIPEPNNREDRNAVKVIVEGLLVGYLAREHAAGFHMAMIAAGHAGCGLTGFKARVVGGWWRKTGRVVDEGSYGVKLYIPDAIAAHLGAIPDGD